jgi:hypothetical protein
MITRTINCLHCTLYLLKFNILICLTINNSTHHYIFYNGMYFSKSVVHEMFKIKIKKKNCLLNYSITRTIKGPASCISFINCT